MKILFAIDGLGAGGKERRFVELVKYLHSQGAMDLEVVVMNEKVHYKDLLSVDIPVHYLLRKKRFDPTIFYKFYRLVKKTKPSIIHCWDGMTTLYSIPTIKFLNIQLINGLVTDAPQGAKGFDKKRFQAKLSFPFSHLIIGNSKAGLQAYQAPEKRSKVLYNGFNMSRLQYLIEKEEIRQRLKINTQFVIGMVASFSPKKDYATFFDAAGRVLEINKNITFVALGHNTDSEEAQALVPPKFKNHFRLLGKSNEVESIVNIFDIGVLSTFTEGISNSILEYMALQKPVIATKGGGTAEIVHHEHTGFLISPSSPGELAQKILTLLENDEMRKQFGVNAFRKINDKFSIEQAGKQYVSLCEQLTKQYRKL